MEYINTSEAICESREHEEMGKRFRLGPVKRLFQNYEITIKVENGMGAPRDTTFYKTITSIFTSFCEIDTYINS